MSRSSVRDSRANWYPAGKARRVPPARARPARAPDARPGSTSTTTGLPSLSRDERQRQIVKVVVFVCFLLPARLGQVLPEVSLLIEQADSHQRNAQVAGRLQMVARQNSQAAGEDREAFGQAKLGREICNQRCVRSLRPGLVEPGALVVHVGLQVRDDAAHVREESIVLCRRLQLLLIDGSQQPHRVMSGRLPEVAVQTAEQLDRVVAPGPAQVVSQREQRFNFGGKMRNDAERLNWAHRKPYLTILRFLCRNATSVKLRICQFNFRFGRVPGRQFAPAKSAHYTKVSCP